MSEYSDLTTIQQAMISTAATRAAHSDTTEIVDSDVHFVIDPITRKIIKNCKKTTLVRGDHNSERLTFECPRYIEGHDMLNCNKISVNYSKVYAPYKVDDLCEGDTDTIVFTWLIKESVTHNVGIVNFSILFQCIQDSGEITYQFGTDINTDLEVIDTIDSGSEIASDNVDVLKQMESEIDEKVSSVNGITPDENGNVEVEIPKGFSGSWNDLTDKPFGEETTISTKDISITWDGDTTDKTAAIGGFGTGKPMAYKVSDKIFTYDQLLKMEIDTESETAKKIKDGRCYDASGAVMYDHDGFASVSIPGTYIMPGGGKFIYPETGIYFPDDCKALRTIEPIVLTEVEIKKIDSKFIPDTIARTSDIPETPEVVQSDWNINDETNPAYVKNRPFYTRDYTEATTIFNVEDGSFGSDAVGIYNFSAENIGYSSFNKNKIYTVVWDDITYSDLVPYELMGIIFVGALITDPNSLTIDFSEYPFLAGISSDTLTILTNSKADSHDIRIDECIPSVVQIPEKYIPEDYINQLIEAKLSGLGGTSAAETSSDQIHFKLYTTEEFEATHPGITPVISPSSGQSTVKYGTKTLYYCGMYNDNDELLYAGYTAGGNEDNPIAAVVVGDDFEKYNKPDILLNAYVQADYYTSSNDSEYYSTRYLKCITLGNYASTNQTLLYCKDLISNTCARVILLKE